MCSEFSVSISMFAYSSNLIARFSLKTPDCVAFASYRSTFELKTNDGWNTIRIPWSDFHGKGPGAENVAFDPSKLRRIGVVAIGREMIVDLAVAKLGFYSVV
jgi:Complex I intermediate-associated protein 30 (CIA30)